MADSTVGALTAASALTGTELFYGVQSANDVKITASQIAAFAGGGGGTGTGDVSGPAGAVADHVATYDGVTGKLIKDGGQTIASIIASSIGGSGNVVGPGSAVSDHIAVFDGVTGRLIKDGGQSLSSLSLTSSQITDFSEATDDRVASLLVAGSNVTLTYNDPANTLTIASTGGGGGGMAIGGTITGATLGSVLFAGTAGVLAQDNAHFFFDQTNNYLKLGSSGTFGAYYLNSFPAVYMVPNASGNNWFESGGGNFTTTGHSNFGTGPGALQFITTGSNNVGLGANALRNLETGGGNFAVGTSAMGANINGDNNTAIGIQALFNLNLSSGGTGNNVALGLQAGFNSDGAANSIYIGTQAGLAHQGETSNCFVGFQSGSSATTGNRNTIVGGSSWFNATSGTSNTMLGQGVGNLLDGGNYNTIIGRWPGPSGASISRVIGIADGTSTNLNLDYNFTKAQVWSFNYDQYWSNPVGLHVYNSQDPGASPTNYERGVFDWNVVSNVLTIGNQHGGTGVARPVNIIGSALTFNGSPIGGGSMAIGGAITSATSGSVLFAGVSGVLTQDNANFFFNDTTNDLKIGGSYFINAARAIYVIPNGSGNNWFEGAAGNATVSGYANFGTGDASLASLTSGFQNVAVGSQTLNKAQSTGYSIAVGSGALHENVSDQFNTAFGLNSLYNLGRAGQGGGGNQNNIGIGFGCGSQIEIGSDNTIVGSQGLSNIAPPTTAIGNTVVGSNAANSLGTAGGASINENTFVGYKCGLNITGGTRNTWIGGYQGPSGAINNSIAVASGNGAVLFDWGITLGFRYSFSTAFGNPASVHIYNSQSSIGSSPTNYERAILDWLNNANVFNIGTEAQGTGTKRLVSIDGFSKAGAPAAGDLPAGSFALIDDTSGGATWLCFNKSGTIRKVQLT